MKTTPLRCRLGLHSKYLDGRDEWHRDSCEWCSWRGPWHYRGPFPLPPEPTDDEARYGVGP